MKAKKNKDSFVYKTKKGLSPSTVSEISKLKNEPSWMREKRLHAYSLFKKKPIPSWGPDLSNLDFNSITYFLRATEKTESTWDKVPDDIKKTYDKLGIPEAEKQFLAGVSAQYESEVVYENVKEELKKQGVLFCDMDTALKKHPQYLYEYFGTLVPPNDNMFASLNSAVWSGGSFIYVPKGVHVDLPLQAYFRINAELFGQFERTLIIADEGSFVHYIEGCTAPQYRTDSLHAAVVEIFVKKNARVRYTTVQNWSKNIYNLVTKRARAEENAIMEWVDANIGSGITMKYPGVFLAGKGAKGEVLSLSTAAKGQEQDTGAKMIHAAPNTSSRIISKSIVKDGGVGTFRSLVDMQEGATNASSYVSCDSLILDAQSHARTYPYMRVKEGDSTVEHEATVEKIGEEKIWYLENRGVSKENAESMIVNGFVDPIAKEIPLEYAIELNRLIQLEMEGSVG